MGRRLLGLAAGVAVLMAGAAATTARAGLPTPEPNAVATVTPVPCTAEAGNAFEQDQYAVEGWSAGDGFTRYGADCQRMRFAFGPIAVKPGQNDVVLEPVAIEKPQYAGYMVRMRPDLVLADGSVPPIEQIHLHHATWLSEFKAGIQRQSPDFSQTRPWFASGEEKTIADLPKGYGMPMAATDDWQLLYMVHNQTTQPFEVFITYDVDFVPKAAAEQRWGIKPAYPMWLDVGAANEAHYGYPVFNVQRKYGDAAGTCTWPAQMCADADPWGGASPNNGTPDPTRHGTDFQLPAAGKRLGDIAAFTGGTLVALGGHLHPGGLSDSIDVVRNGSATRIFTSEAKYWNHDTRTVPDGPHTSWDLSMTWTGMPRWGVHVRPGDVLRINATYDTAIGSTYEDMGIAMAFIAPDSAAGAPSAPGLDPFAAAHSQADNPAVSDCLAALVLCERGPVTHGHMAEAEHYGGTGGAGLSAMPGQVADTVHMAGFLYAPGDLSTLALTGIPQVHLGQKLEFVNEDAALDVYHTATSCQAPCTGSTGIAYPLADAAGVDFDSTELGISPPVFGPASNKLTYDLSVDAAGGFQAGGTYTYFCRIHPFMRGAFQVVQ
jgi:plastocyanin